jgi:hypothetical protein
MKIPAVALVAMFAGGIFLGRFTFVSHHAVQHWFLMAILAGVGAFLCLALVLLQRDFVRLAACASLLSWFALGALASCLTQQPLPAQHILSRLATQQIPLRTPLRWSGILRSEPAHLPWGYSFELNVESVEMAAGTLVTGGMRVCYTHRAGDPPLPPLHAGDEISIFAEARQPLVYKDPGAFDRRAYLANQNIQLLSSLRSTKLLNVTSRLQIPPRFWLPDATGYLRNRLESLFAAQPETSAILLATLLGDRGFLERTESVDYQKTGTSRLLVVAGLHVGALAAFLYWLARKTKTPAHRRSTADPRRSPLLCARRPTTRAGAARRANHCNRIAGLDILPPPRSTQFHCARGSDSSRRQSHL